MARIGASGLGNAESGYVKGPKPATSTNHAVAVWDGTSGRLLKDSSVTVDSNAFVYGEGFLSENNLPVGVTLDVAPTKQIIVMFEYFISGDLLIEGNVLVL